VYDRLNKARRVVMTQQLGRWAAKAFAVVIGTVGLVGLVGCGGSDETAGNQTKPAAKKAPSAAVSEDLVGTWTRTVPARSYTYVTAGKFTMKVSGDGNMEMYDPAGNPTNDCVSQMSCEALTLTARNGKLTVGEMAACTGSGEYSYRITGRRLTTEAVRDGCKSDRPQLFDGATWRRQS
jgi:hypothetical protein